MTATLETLAAPGESAGNGQVDAATGPVPSQPVTRQTRRIAICGTAPSTRNQIPWSEADFEFWSLNDAWKIFPIQEGLVNGQPRMVWFELHPREWYTGPNRPADHLDWLRRCPIPIYMWDVQPDIPSSRRYPIDEMCRLFPGASGRWDLVAENGQLKPRLTRQHGYLTSGIAYMVALAIFQMQPDDELWFWGVDLAAQTEYERQRPNLEYLLGYAEAKGIKVALPSACPVLQGPAYGRDDPNDRAADTARQKIEMLWQRDIQEKHKREAEMIFIKGKLQAWEELRAQWPSR